MINLEVRRHKIGIFLILCCLMESSFSIVYTCTCQPSRYRFAFNFSQTCEDSNIKTGALGIDNVGCTITSNTSGTKPVGIASIEVSELDQNLSPAITTIFNNKTYLESSTIRYSSIIATSRADLLYNTTARPRALQVVMTGIDAEFNKIVNKWVLIFNNACDEAPVLTADQHIGWTTLENLIDPPSVLCPYYQGDGGDSVTPNVTEATSTLGKTASESPDEIESTLEPTEMVMTAPTSAPLKQQEESGTSNQHHTSNNNMHPTPSKPEGPPKGPKKSKSKKGAPKKKSKDQNDIKIKKKKKSSKDSDEKDKDKIDTSKADKKKQSKSDKDSKGSDDVHDKYYKLIRSDKEHDKKKSSHRQLKGQ